MLADLRRKIAGLKRTFKPDIVHLHVADPSVMFHLSTQESYPCASVVTFHHQAHAQMYKGNDTLIGKILNQADWIVTVSHAMQNELCRFAPQISLRSSVIYCSNPPPSVAPAALPWDPPVLLCLGRLIPKKGFDLALQALVRIRASFPAVRLVIAGEGPLRSELEQQAIALGVHDAVELRGRVEPFAVPALINRSTVVLIPSRSEGLPLVALEAASMARPLVSTPVGGLPEVVLPHQTGLLVELGNTAALAEAVLTLLQNPSSATAMGQAARRHVLANFNLEKCAESHDRLYRQLASGRQG
jgi:glycosyltransferase involved in cell wall biosynthesis